MKRNVKLTAITLTAAALLAPLLLGCQDTLVEEKADAKNRWFELRSSMMLDMAKQQFNTGDLTQAQKSVKDGLSIDPTHPGLHVLAGRIALERGKLERAYHLFNASIELAPADPEPYYYQGLVMQRWQRYDSSLEFYEKAYDREPDNPSFLLAVSEALVEMDRIDDAVTLLESKRQYFDQNAGVRATIGHLYILKGQPAKAVEYFHQASLLDPEETKIQQELALSLAASNRHAEAVEVFEKLLKDPDNKDRDDIKRELVAAYLHTENIKDARVLLQDLARGPRGDVSDWIKLGELCYQQDDMGSALQAASKVMNLSPDRHEGYLLAGMVWHRRNNLNNALDMFDRAAQAAPSSTEPLILRGLSLQKAGRQAAAIEAFKEALKRQPNDTRARQLLSAVTGRDG
jgi:tetratricopeptide (TPR) repeat protein